MRTCSGTVMAPPTKKPRLASSWPSPQSLQHDHSFVSSALGNLPAGDPHYQLHLDCSVHDVILLLRSGMRTLCTDTSYLDVPDVVREALTQTPTASITETFDRLIVYTDGSSKSSLRRTIPDRADDPGSGVDTWAFIVLGERYCADCTPGQLFFLGWHAQSVLYDEALTHYIGSMRIGSEVAEREGLFWALLWRLGIDSRTPTCFRFDNMTTLGQAQGLFGAACIDSSVRCLRAAYQALECILPDDHLKMEHTRGHAGDPWNEFADAVARQEAVKSGDEAMAS